MCRGTDQGKRLQKNSAALKVLKSTVAFIILNWKFGANRAGRPAKLSNRGRRALVTEVTKNPMVTLAELQRSCVEMGETFRRITITATLHKHMKACLEFAKSTRMTQD